MKFRVSGAEIEGDLFLYAEKGLWSLKDSVWTRVADYIDVFDFKEKSEKQLKEHPDFLDIDEIFREGII